MLNNQENQLFVLQRGHELHWNVLSNYNWPPNSFTYVICFCTWHDINGWNLTLLDQIVDCIDLMLSLGEKEGNKLNPS